MVQDKDRAQAGHEERVMRVTPAEMRDQPIGSLVSPPSPQPAGSGTPRQEPVDATPRPAPVVTGLEADTETRPWVRPVLIGAGVVTPLAAFALPGVRQTIAKTWRSGTRQAADTLQTGTQQVANSWRAGKRQVTDQVAEVQETRREKQRREVQLKARKEEVQHEYLLKAIQRLERQLAARDRRRGGFLRAIRPVVFGALVSGGLGLLYAPRPGAETRAQIRQSTSGFQERATAVTGQVKEQAQGTLSQIADKVDTVQQQAQGAVSQAKEQAQSGPVAAQASVAEQRPAATQATTPGASSATTNLAAQIKEQMPVVGSDNQPVATVDHLDPGNTIKLTKDAQGQHHWIPLAWVQRVDAQVHLNRPARQARQEWSTSAPQGGRA